MPISAFGYFAFVIIPINYVLIVMYYPAYLIVYENTIRSHEDRILGKMWETLKCIPCRTMDCRDICLKLALDQFEYDLDGTDSNSRSKSVGTIHDEVVEMAGLAEISSATSPASGADF